MVAVLYGCESWKMTEKVKRKLNSAASKMLATITGRTIQEEARNPTINVVMKARDRRWKLAGTRPTHARAPPGAPSPVKTASDLPHETLFADVTKSKYRKRYNMSKG